MASGRRKSNPAAPRGIGATPATAGGQFLPTLEAFVIHGDGQISIGSIGPVPCAAVASDEHNMLAALMRQPDETLHQLLERLDHAVQLALEDEIFTDEINTPIAPSRR